MPDACAKPIAAGTPESGTGTITSASAGASRASSRAHGLAHVVDGAAADDGIRPREIDVFEDAGPRRHRRERLVRSARRPRRTPRTSPFSTSRTYLRADDVERAGLRGEDRAAVELAEHQRADAERIARADQLLVGQADEGIGAFELAQALDEAVDEAVAAARAPPDAGSPRCRWSTASWRLRAPACGAASRPLVRLPLWPMAKPPPSSSANSGCTLRRMVSPVVE